MSRAGGWILATLVLAIVPPTPLAAQDRDATAEEAVATAKQAYGPAAPRARCDPDSQREDVIIVCAELEEQSQFRVRSDEDAENDYAEETMNQGRPGAPNVDGPGIFQGPATFRLASPTPVLIIDLEDIPDAPEGSEADLIGKGDKAP